MSSDTDTSSSYDPVESAEESEELEESGEEWGIVEGRISPYRDEPLANTDDEDTSMDEDEADPDGLSPAVLEARYEKAVSVDSWCCCELCSDETLVGSLEYRCCREVVSSSSKMLFDGSIEKIKCITKHEDFDAITNRAVLLQVAPLLRDTCGKSYRRRGGASQNEFVRAVAYRWTVRWLCGYMGWENTRPLPACVYHSIRKKYPSNQSRGYATALEREK
ncbi:hypothetical protein ACROYT_G023278 [Oculina patagonica]